MRLFYSTTFVCLCTYCFNYLFMRRFYFTDNETATPFNTHRQYTCTPTPWRHIHCLYSILKSRIFFHRSAPLDVFRPWLYILFYLRLHDRVTLFEHCFSCSRYFHANLLTFIEFMYNNVCITYLQVFYTFFSDWLQYHLYHSIPLELIMSFVHNIQLILHQREQAVDSAITNIERSKHLSSEEKNSQIRNVLAEYAEYAFTFFLNFRVSYA